jgi:D-glycero-D-manno-heptose 1,7-bisphosphate phosphatase
MDRPALFLDRDGVINEYRPYVHRIEDFRFIDGIFDLVAAAGRAGYLTIVVTNQAGIGRGLYTEEDFWRLTDWMTARFADHGCRIDRVSFCPTHPQHGIGHYRVHSEFRKPRPGMILEAARDFTIDLGRSILIGDKPSDIEAGLAAGIGTTVLFREPLAGGPADVCDAGQRLSVTDLRDVIHLIRPVQPAER